MTTATLSSPLVTDRPDARLGLPPWAWLLVALLVHPLVGMRFNVALLGWVAGVPWLLYLRSTRGWRARLLFFGVMQLAMFLQVSKIVTEPLPWFFGAMYSVPMALGATAAYLGFEALRRRLGDAFGLALFPAIAVIAEWASAYGSEVGSWGALAYSQLDNLALMQTTSLFGLTGVSALLAASSTVITVLIARDDRRRFLPVALGLFALVTVAWGWGSVRLHQPIEGPMVTVATVTSDVGPGPSGLPDAETLARANDALFERTRLAAERGAELVVWNEGATAVEAKDEAAFLARGQALATELGLDVVLAYVVPLEGMSRFENKYVWLTPEGVAETYLKHHPVPGEGSVKGTAPLQVLSRPYGEAAGAICYDYDFPGMGREHARLGAGVVVVPASDWLGIDPYHTQMAAVRGIEGGFSVVRSVRWATSGAFDHRGVARGQANWFEGDRLMVARIPARQSPTLYRRTGEVLPVASGAIFLFGLGALVRRRRHPPAV